MTKKVKLPITQAEEMRKYFALNNIKNKDIAEMLNVSPAAIQDDIREFRRDQGGGDPEKERLWELVDRLTRAGDAAPGKDADGGKSAKD